MSPLLSRTSLRARVAAFRVLLLLGAGLVSGERRAAAESYTDAADRWRPTDTPIPIEFRRCIDARDCPRGDGCLSGRCAPCGTTPRLFSPCASSAECGAPCAARECVRGRCVPAGTPALDGGAPWRDAAAADGSEVSPAMDGGGLDATSG